MRRVNLPTPATPQEVQAFIVHLGGIIENRALCPPSQFAGDDEPRPLITEELEQWWDEPDDDESRIDVWDMTLERRELYLDYLSKKWGSAK